MEAARQIRLTRRTILKSSVAATAAIALAACGGAAPTPTPASAAKATTGTSATTSANTTTGAASSTSPTVAASSGTATSPTVAAAGAQPKKGGTLKISQPIPITPFEFQQLGPHTATTILGVFDTLIRYDAKQQPQPWLAESWSYNADKTELTLKLRQSVLYHTGRAFTSEDVKCICSGSRGRFAEQRSGVVFLPSLLW